MSRARHRTWLIPDAPDVLDELQEQVFATVEGMDSLARWAAGDDDCAAEVRDAAHDASHRRQRLATDLRAAFSTTIAPEDLLAVSRAVEQVLDAAVDAVREGEVLHATPDGDAATMAALLAEGTRGLSAAVAALGRRGPAATEVAQATARGQRALEPVYEAAMRRLADERELAHVLAMEELYRRLAEVSERIVAAADRVVYTALKQR